MPKYAPIWLKSAVGSRQLRTPHLAAPAPALATTEWPAAARMSAQTPGSPAPGPALELDPDPDPDPRFTLYQGPRSFRVTDDSTAIYSIVAPDTGRLHSILVRAVQMDINFGDGPPVGAKLFAKPAAVIPITAKPFVKLFVKPVLAGMTCAAIKFRAVPSATSAATGDCCRPPAKPNFAESGPLLAIDGHCIRLAAPEFGVRPPAKPNFLPASATAAGSLLTAGTRTARPPAKPDYIDCDPLLSTLQPALLDSLLTLLALLFIQMGGTTRPPLPMGLLPSGTPVQVAAQPQKQGGIGGSASA